MCGIIGIANQKIPAAKDLIYGLKTLEYRGYDSAGVVFFNSECYKTIQSIEMLEKMISHSNEKIGIAHTRWATHGKICLDNAHPIKIGSAFVVHNGILENACEIKKQLNYNCQTETDTEILLALLLKLIQNEKNILSALNKLSQFAFGSYAAAFLFSEQNTQLGNIFWIKNGLSPLIIAVHQEGNVIASDECAIPYNAIIHELPTQSFGFINNQTIEIFPKINLKNYQYILKQQNEKKVFATFFEQEMHEQIEIFDQIQYKDFVNFEQYDSVILTGCGSAYIACTIGKIWLQEIGINAIAEIASEWNSITSSEKNTLVILISQSGETADTLLALRKAKEKKLDTLAIVNKENSTITKEANKVFYLNIGQEKSVASTKAFCAQLAKLLTLAKPDLQFNLSNKIKQILNINLTVMINQIIKAKRVIIIGKHIMYSIALEGALKLKELTYMNVEALPAGELKHGYIALIDNETCVIALLPNSPFFNKILSNIQEIKTREGKIILITQSSCIKNLPNDLAELIIEIPESDYDSSTILFTILFQRLAFEIAKKNNFPIDKPRNLAKAVTVE